MIQSDAQLHQAQADIQKLWRFLESARQTHGSVDYERLAAPYLLTDSRTSARSVGLSISEAKTRTHDSRLGLDGSVKISLRSATNTALLLSFIPLPLSFNEEVAVT